MTTARAQGASPTSPKLSWGEVMSLGGGDRRYSAMVSPVPPTAVGKSLSFGSPSFIGSTASA